MSFNKYKNKIFSLSVVYFSKPRLLILAIPYIIFSNLAIDYFSWIHVSVLLIFFYTVDFILLRIKRKLLHFISYLFITYFLYSLIIYNDTYYILHQFRFRNFSLLFLFLFGTLFYQKIINYKDFSFINVIIIIFSILQLLTFENETSRDEIFKNYNLETDLIKFQTKNESRKPIILLICDGLTSTNEIYNLTNNDKDLEFDNFLKLNDYVIIQNFETQSIWTQFSLSSLLNFNFHKSDTIKKLEFAKENVVFADDFKQLVYQNLLVDSLINNSVNSYSYGVLPFSKAERTNNVIHLWEKLQFNFDIEFFKENKLLQTIFHKSVMNFIDSRYLNGRTYVFDSNRENTLYNLKNTEFEKSSFYYFHYYAPHSPFSYFNEFEFLDESNDLSEVDFYNHVNYRRFMLRKLIDVLKSPKFDNVRIILTGDHGYRSELTDGRITMAAFKGFDPESIKQIRNVQDIGSFILYSMK
ncbi:MAG: hypothetical protein CMC91_03775 [Flavobacteriaceae bacterium]|nr:hypothetical protein [Flavobacteriaceae bacterium]|tara:strand:+ start:22535 stop:23938 length:1404 start_codon:yes stop_codon:yes gene_type:complete